MLHKFLDFYKVINLKMWFLFNNELSRSDAFALDGLLLDVEPVMPPDLQVDRTDTSSYL